MDLIVHHVFETLVVSGPEEDLGGQLAARETVIQHLQDPREDSVVRIPQEAEPDAAYSGHVLLTSFPLRW